MTSVPSSDSAHDAYVKLIESFCANARMDPQHILDGGSISYEGVNFNLFHSAGSYSPLLLMYCDFGPVAADMQLYAYRTLLETNLSTYSGQGENFALTPEGNVVYTNNFIIEGLSADTLAMHIGLAAVYAKNWKAGKFFANAAKSAERDKFSALFKQ